MDISFKTDNLATKLLPGPPTHILMKEGPSDFFGSKILAKSDFFFWVHERCRDFFWSRKKQRDVFRLQNKGLRDIFGYAKKSSNLLGRQILKL